MAEASRTGATGSLPLAYIDSPNRGLAEREGIQTLRVELPTAASKPAAALANGDLSTHRAL